MISINMLEEIRRREGLTNDFLFSGERAISLSLVSHGYHIRTSCQRADELDQSLGTRPAFHTPPDPIARPDRLVFESTVQRPPDSAGIRRNPLESGGHLNADTGRLSPLTLRLSRSAL